MNRNTVTYADQSTAVEDRYASEVIGWGAGLTRPEARRFVRAMSEDAYRRACRLREPYWTDAEFDAWWDEWWPQDRDESWPQDRIAYGDMCSPDGSYPWEVDEIFYAEPGYSVAETRRREARRRLIEQAAQLTRELRELREEAS